MSNNNNMKEITSYGSVQNINNNPSAYTPITQHSNAATITNVLDIPSVPSPPNNNTQNITDSSTDTTIPSLPLPPTNNHKKHSTKIQILNKTSSTSALLNYPYSVDPKAPLIITSKENNNYYKQKIIGKANNASKSLSSIPRSPSSILTNEDILHHIEHHLLAPLGKIMLGTPHHGEAHMEHYGESPIRRVIFNMLNSIIGAGVVGLPYVYSTAGLFGGLALMVFFAFISAYSLKLLIISARVCKQSNYEDLCEYCFGLKGYYFVSMVMFVFDFGATLSYLIILGDASSQIIALWGYDTVLDRQLTILFVSICIILPTILPRDLSKIEKVSALSVGSVILIMVVVIYEWIAYRFLFLQKNEGYDTYLPTNVNWGIQLEGLPLAVGIIAFAFVCHDSSFLIYNTLKNPTIPRWSILAYSGCFTAVAICACFAVPGYLTFGGEVSDNILNNYETNNILIIISRAIYCITMALTYPCSFFVVRHVLYAIFHHGPHYQSIREAPLWKHLLFTIPIFIVNVFMGIFIQNLGIVMSVSGSLSAVILAFVLPTLCYLKICRYKIFFWKEKGYNRKWRAFKTTFPPTLLCAFGMFIAVFSTSFTIMQEYGLSFN